MTNTVLPQVAGFDAPIGGGFWTPVDREAAVLTERLVVRKWLFL
jgi:hypothetical protein